MIPTYQGTIGIMAAGHLGESGRRLRDRAHRASDQYESTR
jgi:hypothetical protein